MNHLVGRLICGLALILLAPVFLVVALLILIDSPGPVFFRQERVGKNGELFKIHKFRTMVARHSNLAVSGTGDPRITRSGRILRRTKIDELPQLIDVVQGKMALVGPRPEVPQYVSKWPDQLRPLILSVLPGITDPASIEFRNEADLLAEAKDPETYYIEEILPRKAELYAQYVQGRSPLGDLKIIFNTLGAVVKE